MKCSLKMATKRFDLVVHALSGNVLHWFQYRRKGFQGEWRRLKKGLLQHYGKILDQADYARRLFSLNYDPGTNFTTFVWNYRSMYKLWSETTSEREIIGSLVKQLLHPYSVILYPISNFEVLIERYNECRDSGLWDKLAGNSTS